VRRRTVRSDSRNGRETPIMQQGRNNEGDSQINNGKKSIFQYIYNLANNNKLATAISLIIGILGLVLGFLSLIGAYNLLPCQNCFTKAEPHENLTPPDHSQKRQDVSATPSGAALSDAQQASVAPPPTPPVQNPSRLSSLLAALDQWRSLGVKADPGSLSLLQAVKNEDQVIFAKASDSTWDEIQAPKDILRAPEIRLTAATLSRLPVFVKSVQQTERDLKLTQKVSQRLVDAGFRMSANEQHAAVIIVLGAHKFVDIPNYPSGPSGVQEFWAERVTLTAYAIYNINNEELFPEFSVTGYAEGSTEISRDKLAGCALLDAGLNATDKFIEMIGAKSRPFREKC
jgi:hypothetical protein